VEHQVLGQVSLLRHTTSRCGVVRPYLCPLTLIDPLAAAEVPISVRMQNGTTKPPAAESTCTVTSTPPSAASLSSAAQISRLVLL